MGRDEVTGREVKLYTVVCTDLHTSYGPIAGLESAILFAKNFNEASRCLHVPVPFLSLAGDIRAVAWKGDPSVKGLEFVDKVPAEKTVYTGQYL